MLDIKESVLQVKDFFEKIRYDDEVAIGVLPIENYDKNTIDTLKKLETIHDVKVVNSSNLLLSFQYTISKDDLDDLCKSLCLSDRDLFTQVYNFYGGIESLTKILKSLCKDINSINLVLQTVSSDLYELY